jgi:transcriptional regulator with XRE-family HTH domain
MLTGAQCRLARRNELGISQAQLAKDAGVSRSYITNFEGGVFEPTDKVKQKLLTYFESKGVDLGESPDAGEEPAADDAIPASGRTAGTRAGRLRGPECVFVSGKLATEAQRERILERIFAIRDRLEEIAGEPAKPGFIDPYDEKTDSLVSEGRALVAEIGVLYGRLFGHEFAAVPTSDMLSRKARPASVADALGLVFRDVFSALGIRRNSSRNQGEGADGAANEELPASANADGVAKPAAPTRQPLPWERPQ